MVFIFSNKYQVIGTVLSKKSVIFERIMKNILLLAALSVSLNTINAQDLIAKKDGSIIKAKILEVGEESIKYKKFDNPDGPNYTLSKESITSINYANGEVEKFSSSETKKKSEEVDEFAGEEKSKPNPILEDENMKKSVESTAKDVGEQLIRSCANGKVDNSTTEVFWDGVFKDGITKELVIPIITKWKPKFTDGTGKWIKGKILVSSEGTKKWVYQNDNGLMFSGCAKGFKIK